MDELAIGIGLVLVIEGLLYAAFPDGLKALAQQLPAIPNGTLRNFGVIAMMIGVAIIWFAKKAT
ncbi:MAG: DUF2065 domain-containing protein [Rhizobiaceae bacterium]